MSALGDLLASDRYRAWVDAANPEDALRTWPRVTLQANGTSGRGSRAGQINALRRAIESFPWADSAGRPFTVRLILESKAYSETHGFEHSSRFTYRVTGDLIRLGG